MKPPLRTKSVGTKVSEAGFAVMEDRARAAGLTLSEWVQDGSPDPATNYAPMICTRKWTV